MPRVPKAQVPRVEACGQGVNVCHNGIEATGLEAVGGSMCVVWWWLGQAGNGWLCGCGELCGWWAGQLSDVLMSHMVVCL